MTGERAYEAQEWVLSAIAQGERRSRGLGPAGHSDPDVMILGLPAVPESVREAREFARAVLGRWGLSHRYDDVGLIVSELVTNALRHAPGSSRETGGPPIRLSLLRRGAQLTCAVTDLSDEIPVHREPDYASQSGRGLHLVEAFSDSWSWVPLFGGGKVVWASLTVCPGR